MIAWRMPGLVVLVAVAVGTPGALPADAAARSPRAVVVAYSRAALGGADTSRFLAADAQPFGDACYVVATDTARVRRVRVRGNNATVEVAVRAFYTQGCTWGTRYYPGKPEVLHYNLKRAGGRWRIAEYHPLVPLRTARRYWNRPYYLVIAGSFRTRAAAENHALWMNRGDAEWQVERSDDFAGLQPGWFIVLPESAAAESDKEADRARTAFQRQGLSAYVHRVR